MSTVAPELVARFWSKVDKAAGAEGCWTWKGYLSPKGYGRFFPRRFEPVLAHRYAWEVAHGSVPNGMLVCHRCDRPACVNPAHLFLGTIQDNSDDKMAKGRHRGGRQHGTDRYNAKLSDELVREIRRRHADGVSTRAMAREYGLSGANLHRIVRRQSWAHVA